MTIYATFQSIPHVGTVVAIYKCRCYAMKNGRCVWWWWGIRRKPEEKRSWKAPFFFYANFSRL